MSKILKVIFLAALASAAAIPSSNVLTRASGQPAVAILLQIAPTSNTCVGASFPSECETAEQAAPFLIQAMNTYGVSSSYEIAALLSLIAYESGDFKYNIHHFPSANPGQGTRNMQMGNFNFEYAKSIPALASTLKAITTASSAEGLTDDQLNAVLALVLPDEYSYASAAWFLTTQCASARPALQAGGLTGYQAYLSCVGTTATSDRLAVWQSALTALGLK